MINMNGKVKEIDLTDKVSTPQSRCLCEDYVLSMSQIVGAQRLAANRGVPYTGKVFDYCPWCGAILAPVA